MKIRFKCLNCGDAFNIRPEAAACPKCKKPVMLSNEGKLFLYRQGSVYGVAGGFGVYINGEPYGHIGNKELLCLPLPYGNYNIHCAVGISRKCRDLPITLSPNMPEYYAKVYIRPGFWTNDFVVEPVERERLEREGHLK